jgi:hypothetical protein
MHTFKPLPSTLVPFFFLRACTFFHPTTQTTPSSLYPPCPCRCVILAFITYLPQLRARLKNAYSKSFFQRPASITTPATLTSRVKNHHYSLGKIHVVGGTPSVIAVNNGIPKRAIAVVAISSFRIPLPIYRSAFRGTPRYSSIYVCVRHSLDGKPSSATRANVCPTNVRRRGYFPAFSATTPRHPAARSGDS